MPLGSANYGWRSKDKVDNRPNIRVPGVGPTDAKIMLVGERPGEKEAKVGRPFIGLAGAYLDRYLDDAGLDRSSIYITNVVKEFANYDKPTPFELGRDWPELVEEIAKINPKVIGMLGTFATEQILGVGRANLERTHGIPVECPFMPDTVCVPVYHPAAGIYNQDVMAQCQADFTALAAIAAAPDGNTYIRCDEFLGKETYGKRNEFNEPVKLDCAIDTEGSRKAPWCATFSTGYGMSWIHFPNQLPLEIQSRVVYLHNSLHDLSVLRSMGTFIHDGQFVDTMVWAYLLCLEPQGLKDLAWRHAGMEMNSYQEIIGTADRDKALEYLVGADAVEWEKAGEYVIIEGGIPRIKKPHSINQRIRRILADVDLDKRNKNGDPVDPRDRWNNIDDYLKQEVVETLGPMPEATLDDVPRAKAIHYACRDSDATLRIAPRLKEKIVRLGLQGVSDIDHAIIPMVDRMQQTGIGLAPESFWNELEDECDAQMGTAKLAIYRATGASINPDSPDQVAALLFDQIRLPVIKLTDKGDPSTKDKALESIYAHSKATVNGVNVVDMVLEYREASKVRSSYVNPLRARVRRGEHRAHPNMRITRVSSGRPACTNPNLLAIPVRSNLGKKVRGGFVAGESRLLLDYDLDQVEMRWMADESRDAGLVKLFIDGIEDVHTRTAAGMFSVAYGNVKAEQRYAAKRVGFGVITGITEYGLVDQMALARAKRPDGKPWTLDDCQIMIKEYFKIYPAVKIFMDAAGDEAETTGMARDRWGRIRYLPGARSPIPAVAAESRRQASSFKIQAGAQGLMKRAMIPVWDLIKQLGPCQGYGWDDMWPVEPLLQIYDSLLFDIAEEYEWIVTGPIKDAMTQTTPSNTGLPFKAKGGTGKQWDKIK